MTIIKIDWDKEKGIPDLIDFENEVKTILRILNLKKAKYKRYKTTNGYHIYLDLKKPMRDSYVVIIQCLLGSDKKREMFNFERVVNKQKYWNVLFGSKYKGGKLVSKETFIEEDEISI
jgi:hypothetical protein